MFSLRYVHASALHLNASFRGVRMQNPLGCNHGPLEQILRTATCAALDGLVALCQREKPDFVVLSGDMYHAEEGGIHAQMALHDACLRLEKTGIAVLWAHGQHDPFSSRLRTLEWPQNTTVFTTEKSHVVIKHRETQQPLAVVHGISYDHSMQGQNLLAPFERLGGEYANSFQLAVLPLDSLGGASDVDAKNETHPTTIFSSTVQDMQDSGLDAFALGQSLTERVVLEKPFVAYSGIAQGLHRDEHGSKGCMLVHVTAEDEGGPYTVQSSFHPLGPVLWEHCDIALDSIEQIHEVEERIQEALDDVASYAPSHARAVLVRLRLTGQTPLDTFLRATDFCKALVERVQQQQGTQDSPVLQENHDESAKNMWGTQDTWDIWATRSAWATQNLACVLWLNDIVVETVPLIPLEDMSQRDDLLGEVLRLGQSIEQEDDKAQAFVCYALQELFAHDKVKHLLQEPTAEQSQKLLKEAQRLCAYTMEQR